MKPFRLPSCRVMAKRACHVCGLPESETLWKDRVGRPDIEALKAMMMREDHYKGFFVAFDYFSDALTEVSQFFRRSVKIIIPLTAREVLDEEQRRIVSGLDVLQAEVDALKRLQTKTATELDALVPAIFDRAFKGEL